VLLEVHLRDLGLISDATVEFSPGLNVVTGETGVGKTLLVTSVALLAGARGNARLVKAGATESVVQAVVAPNASVAASLEALGVDATDELVLVRKLGGDGRSRAWIAGQLAPMSTLAEVGAKVVEIHGQGAAFTLAQPLSQLAALDAFAGTAEQLRAYRSALDHVRELEAERDALATDERTRTREIELLAYQADEIERARLEPDADERLERELPRLEHAERLSQIGEEVVGLAGSEGAAGQLSEAHRSLEGAAGIDPSALPLAERLGVLASEAAEVAHDIRAWAEGLDPDPAHLESLRERRALIASLKKKYGATIDEVIAFGDDARARMQQLESSSERIASIDGDIEQARATLDRVARELSKQRRKAAKELTRLVTDELPALALPNATFEIGCEEGEPTEHGRDRVSFMFSSSRSSAPDLIGKIASGGELSRAMIAVTLALASSHEIPVLLFDEADQGVGGEAALDLARRLARLARTHQVLVVSHLPQIAAYADRHLSVRRSGDDIRVEALEGEDRLAEISRMLAGVESSDLARGHAAELVDMARRDREPAQASGRVKG
jgi:DNA repair protein RecN (Recombination protein N)